MTKRVTALAMFAVLPALLCAKPAAANDDVRAAKSDATSKSEGTVKQLPGGAVLRLAPGTVIELGRSLKLQLAPPGQPQTLTQTVKLISGRVDVEIPLSKAPKTAVLFQAPHKVSAVAKGGHSIAIADADRITLVAVDGDMLAASGNDWKTLPKGLVRTFVGSSPSYQERKVPSAPTLSVSKPLLFASGSELAKTSVQTGGVKDADHYQFCLWKVGEKSNELLRQIDVRSIQSELSGLQPGQYQVTARAVDSSGISGPDSITRNLRVVGAELPAGSRYEAGAILLGARHRVKLLGATGLEASYNASSHFVSAPDSVGLTRGESTLLRLREPGSTEELRVALEPRTLHADVKITPKHPRWPEDMIEVTVHLFDARGRAVSEAVKVKPQVLVNVQPMAVKWMRSGNTLHTFIPAPAERGPWVVRVEIADEFGDPAGRDFMEVAAPDSERVSAR